MNMNQWKVTRDIINGGEHNTTTSAIYDSALDMPVQWRAYDDDGNLYFEGIMQEHDFEPLDDFCMPGFGCTYLETREPEGDRIWRVL